MSRGGTTDCQKVAPQIKSVKKTLEVRVCSPGLWLYCHIQIPAFVFAKAESLLRVILTAFSFIEWLEADWYYYYLPLSIIQSLALVEIIPIELQPLSISPCSLDTILHIL